MANEQHLLLTAIGSYTDSVLANETWAMSLRIALVFGNIDPVGTFPNNWSVVATNINRTESSWTITGNWSVADNGAVFAPDDFLNDQVAPAYTTWFQNQSVSAKTRLEQLKLSPIGAPTGKLVPAPPYLQGSPCVLTWTNSNPTGGGAGNILPLQDSVVISHLTAQPGRRGRGRQFAPGIDPAALTATGYLDTAKQTALAGTQKTFLQALTGSSAGALAAHWQPCVTGKPFTQYAVINAVAVGNVVDTQRRRRRSLPETRVTVAL